MKLTSERAKEISKLASAGKRVSLRGKINAMCKYCIYDTIGGNGSWRQQVSACTDKACPLHEVRPQSDSTPENTPISAGEIPDSL